jgi:very-short-patch-repair endonuclease
MLRDRARALRNRLTDTEQHLWQRLRRKQLSGHRFRRQVPLGRYIVDFTCFEARVIVEVDGGQHAEDIMRDWERDHWLSSQGFRVLRFWNNDVLRETDAVVEMIVRALMQPPPHPSPIKGEGELVKGADHSRPPHPSPVKGEGERSQAMHEIPPPLAGGGEGEG